MAQDVATILANAKKTLSEAENKFPSSPSMPQPDKPSYSMAHDARKEPGLGAELKAKSEMVGKARKALE